MRFIRGPITSLADHSVDSTMLAVYFALDGIKTDEDIARSLVLPVREVRKAINALSSLDLIVSANGSRSSAASASGREKKDPEAAVQSTKPSKPSPPVSAPARSKPSQTAKDEPTTSASLNDVSSSGGTKPDAPEAESPQPTKAATVEPKSGDDLFVTNSGGPTRTGDFFNIGNKSSDAPADPFASHNSQTKGTDLQKSSAGSKFQGASHTGIGSGSYAAQALEILGRPQNNDSPEKMQALEFFEQGLASIQRKDYQEALQLFERSIKLNPDNKVCRANIQRINKILSPDNPKNFR